MTPVADRGGAEASTTRWIRSERALFRRLADGVVVLLPPASEPEVLTGSGVDLWDLLARARTLDELTATLSQRYDHDPDTIRRDLDHTLEGLTARHLVVAAP